MKKIRFALAAVVFAAIFHFVPFLDPAEAWLSRAVLGVAASVRGASSAVAGFAGNVGRAAELEKENGMLKARLLELEEKAAAVRGLAAENEDLKGLVAYGDRTGHDLVSAQVIGSDPDATVRALIIDRGAEEGIKRGDPVIVGNGTFVGKIERVSPGRSTVLLPTDPRSSIAVMDADHPEADGVAQGEKGLVVSMMLIPQRAPIEAGDSVITTGRDLRIPRGLVVGRIESVRSVASDPFMSATVIPAAEPISLTKVAVIRSK